MKLTAGSRIIELPLDIEAEERLFLEFSGKIYKEFAIATNKQGATGPTIKNNTGLSGGTPTPTRRKLVFDSRRLIIGRCKCGKHYSIWLDDRKSFYNFVCSGCEANIYIKDENLVESSYRCTECNKKYSFWSNGTLPFSLNCKNCKTGLEMHYDKETGMMVNTIHNR